MKKSFKLQDLGCANCARKMQDAIGKIQGVSSVSVNFLMQKLTLEADDGRLEQVLPQIQSVIKRIEPDCVILS